jgi:hypothetical protein
VAHFLIIAITIGTCLSCGPSRRRAPAIGAAYVAPISLNLREDLAPRAPVTATVHHGQRLEILAHRRRFTQVRTEEGAEGWTDGRQLLSPQAMRRLEQAHEQGRKLPSQGRAIAFDLLNVHIVPNRLSPSFFQLTEDAPADVIGRKVTRRVPYIPDQENPTPPPEENKDAIKDDWTRVRLSDGRSGWVLSRMLLMDLPDEITQLADGHRITSAFRLGEVMDQGEAHPSWMWTTIAKPPEEYQFDSVKVFVWNSKRDRYETAYVERGLKGYYPVLVDTAAGEEPRIQIIAAGKDEQLYRRTFRFVNHRLRQVERRPWIMPRSDGVVDASLTWADPEKISPISRLWRWWRGTDTPQRP